MATSVEVRCDILRRNTRAIRSKGWADFMMGRDEEAHARLGRRCQPGQSSAWSSQHDVITNEYR
jgi:hypothetical protein